MPKGTGFGYRDSRGKSNPMAKMPNMDEIMPDAKEMKAKMSNKGGMMTGKARAMAVASPEAKGLRR